VARQVNIISGSTDKVVAKVVLVNGKARFKSDNPKLWTPKNFFVGNDEDGEISPADGNKYMDNLPSQFRGGMGYRTEEVVV
jgi:hypothetical protein